MSVTSNGGSVRVRCGQGRAIHLAAPIPGYASAYYQTFCGMVGSDLWRERAWMKMTEQPATCRSCLKNEAADPIYCVVNTTTSNLLGEFDSMAEAQGFLRDLGDYTDNIVVEAIDE